LALSFMTRPHCPLVGSLDAMTDKPARSRAFRSMLTWVVLPAPSIPSTAIRIELDGVDTSTSLLAKGSVHPIMLASMFYPQVFLSRVLQKHDHQHPTAVRTAGSAALDLLLSAAAGERGEPTPAPPTRPTLRRG